MERINGVALEKHWFNTFDEDIGAVLWEILFLDLDLHEQPFSQIGSLFFNEEPAAGKYRIGPVAEKQYWFNEPIEGDRGPWLDMVSFIEATCHLALRRAESQASSAVSSPPSPSSLLSRSKPSDLPELRRLLQQSPYLIHPDLSRSNVIVKSSRAANVVSYVEWQGAVALPYLQSISLPEAVLYVGKCILIEVARTELESAHQNPGTRWSS
ncbi:hypothetical protein EDD85DRAFT_957005 [Armillaria nabsnona]|nr:hypothetical protein EDD85DRAFT_957005 [Armillaria nabsnona]